jgi:hypothetical protein
MPDKNSYYQYKHRVEQKVTKHLNYEFGIIFEISD